MPATCAHYSFSVDVYKELSNRTKDIIKENKNYFVLGAQGPDLLFYYSPIKDNPIYKLGSDLHRQSFYVFLDNLINSKELEQPNKLVYILGCCCHFILDRNTHPYIYRLTGQDSVAHAALETDFEQYVIDSKNMSRQRKNYTADIEDYKALGDIYGVEEHYIKKSVKNFPLIMILLEKYKAIDFLENRFNSSKLFSRLSINKPVEYNVELKVLKSIYNNSIAEAAKLIEEVFSAAEKNTPLPSWLNYNFLGEKIETKQAKSS